MIIFCITSYILIFEIQKLISDIKIYFNVSIKNKNVKFKQDPYVIKIEKNVIFIKTK